MGRLRDGVGAAVRWAASFTEAVADPLGEFTGPPRTHPHTVLPLRPVVRCGLRVTMMLKGPAGQRWRLVRGEFVAGQGPGERTWCDAEVLRILRRRSLATEGASRPVNAAAYRTLPAGTTARFPRATRASTGWPRSSISSPASGYRPRRSNRWCRPTDPRLPPAMLDELLRERGTSPVGAGSISGSDGCRPAPHRLGAHDAGRPANRLSPTPTGRLSQPGHWRRVLLPPVDPTA